MIYARIENNTVVEIIFSDNIDDCYHTDFVATLTKVGDDVNVGMVKVGDKFQLPKSDKVSIEEHRKSMQLSAADARIRLADKGLLLRINEVINRLPDDDQLKIKWEYATVLNRTDPHLEDFCKSTLGMNDEMIDELFS